MVSLNDIRRNRDVILHIAARHGARDVRVFGSFVRGEATKRISETTKQKRSEIIWRDVAGFRDVLIHDYMGVDLNEVWNIIENHLPALRNAIRQLLKS